MKKQLWVVMMSVGLLFCGAALAAKEPQLSYEESVAQWHSYQDVAAWLEKNFKFDKSRQKYNQGLIKSKGLNAAVMKKPQELYKLKKGYCTDAANFAMQALNSINPAHNAQLIFIKNAKSQLDNHWVTGFKMEDKIYVMDFGAGPHWSEIKGVHGPYNGLEEYQAFLDSKGIRNLQVQFLDWRVFPGVED